MNRQSQHWIIALCCFVCSLSSIVSSGCSKHDGPQRAIVFGTVSYHGTPIATGEIRFTPTRETVGPITLASIVDGRYRADANGGVPVGIHKVQIYGYVDNPAARPELKGTPMERPPQQFLPPKYNDKTELELTVESGSPTVAKDFELTP